MSDKRTFILQPYPHPSREKAIEAIKSAQDGFVVEIKPPRRNRGQNDLSHALYEDIARALPEDDALGWKCYTKLHHGVPLLRAEDEEFRETYDKAIKGLTYEQKLAVMKILPVTSLMNKKQISKYIEAVKADFIPRGVVFGHHA